MADTKEAASLISLNSCSVKVSSVLNKDVKEYGKKFMFDGNDDTCWNSDQGSPQFVLIEFPDPVSISKLEIKFQGGFASTDCILYGNHGDGDTTTMLHFYPSDVNALQVFQCEEQPFCKSLKLQFSTSSDFFGRIIVYYLQLFGTRRT